MQDSFKNTIISNFYKNIDWLGRSEAVYKEVTEVTTVFANSCVPAKDKGEIPATLAGRIEEFLDVYLSTSGDVESKKAALTDLLSCANLTALGTDELDDTYYAIKRKVDAVPGVDSTTTPPPTEDEVKKEQKNAVYDALEYRATKIRGFSEKGEVVWSGTALETATVADTVRTASDRAEALRKSLYNSVAEGIDSNKLSIYLSLFCYCKINQQDQPEFFQKILDEISGDSNVENVVYSVVGEEYEKLLRHSNDVDNDVDLARQKKLVDAVSKISPESTDEQKAEAVAGSIETLDNATAGKVGSFAKVLKKVS